MDETRQNPADGKRRERLVQRLDGMVESGRVTEQEAERLRTASEPSEFDKGLLSIRLRHARASLDAAVRDGVMTREEADGFLGRLRGGEHTGALRAQLRSLRRGTPPGTPVVDVNGTKDRSHGGVSA